MLTDTFHISGLPSPGKAKLIAALDAQAARLALQGSRPLHIHAETDLEGMLEGSALTSVRAEARTADIVILVDWEPVAHSVARVLDAMSCRSNEDA